MLFEEIIVANNTDLSTPFTEPKKVTKAVCNVVVAVATSAEVALVLLETAVAAAIARNHSRRCERRGKVGTWKMWC